MKKLALVEPHHVLSGKFPRGFERGVRACSAGDATHRGLIHCCAALAQRAIHQCLPPTVAEAVRSYLRVTTDWAANRGTLRDVKSARAECFERGLDFETKTVSLIHGWIRIPQTDLERHQAAVTLRYVALSVNLTVASVLRCCDAITQTGNLLEIPKDVASAIAYRNVALGPARSNELVTRAEEQALWEYETLCVNKGLREAAGQDAAQHAGHTVSALAMQLLHEYLGVHWKNQVDAQRLYLEQFLDWAIPDQPA